MEIGGRKIEISEPTGEQRKVYLIALKAAQDDPEKGMLRLMEAREKLILKLTGGAFKDVDDVNTLKVGEQDRVMDEILKRMIPGMSKKSAELIKK